jgi:hypothetical protein
VGGWVGGTSVGAVKSSYRAWSTRLHPRSPLWPTQVPAQLSFGDIPNMRIVDVASDLVFLWDVWVNFRTCRTGGGGAAARLARHAVVCGCVGLCTCARDTECEAASFAEPGWLLDWGEGGQGARGRLAATLLQCLILVTLSPIPTLLTFHRSPVHPHA